MPENPPLIQATHSTPNLDADPDYRWGVEAVLRQALLDLENGQHVGLMIVRLKRALTAIEEKRDERYGEGPDRG